MTEVVGGGVHPAAVAMILTGAVLHATWNMLVRRGGHPEAFAWWLAASAAVLWLPLGVYLWLTVGIPAAGWPFVVATSVIHAIYFVLLGRAYEHGELSLVYPIARGTGPLLVPAIAVPLLGERLTPVGIVGVALIVIGVVTLQMGGLRAGAFDRLIATLRLPAARYALATGVTIAVYTVVDKAGVGVVHAVLYGYLLFAGSAALASIYFWRARRVALLACWRDDRRSILIAGVISPITYFLALAAFQLGQVSYLGPMREISIVLAALLGALALRERVDLARMVSAAVTALGVAIIAFGG